MPVRAFSSSRGTRRAGCENKAKQGAPAAGNARGANTGPAAGSEGGAAAAHGNSKSSEGKPGQELGQRLGHAGSKHEALAASEAHAGIVAKSSVHPGGGVRGGVNVGSGIEGDGVRGAELNGLMYRGTGAAGRNVSNRGPRWGETLLPCTEQHARTPPVEAEKQAKLATGAMQEEGKALQQWRDKEVREVGRELTLTSRPHDKELAACRKIHGPVVSTGEAVHAERKMQAFWSVKIADTTIRNQAAGPVSVLTPRFLRILLL